jgi:transketolase
MTVPTEAAIDLELLDRRSRETRQLILETIHHAGAGHVGGPLSVTDILVSLYFRTLRINPEDPRWVERDRCILSKGHSSIALYAVLALRGYFPIEELKTFDAIDSRLQGHPDMSKLTGLDMSTGSLGQGLSPGIGMALAARQTANPAHTWVILGDGELQEGQIWEAAYVAARYNLDSVTAIVDLNTLPQFSWPDQKGVTRDVPYGDAASRFSAFGWNTIEVDGHDHRALAEAFDTAIDHKGQPTAIIARTVKGKGVSFMEGQYTWHATVPSADELAAAIAELHAGKVAS